MSGSKHVNDDIQYNEMGIGFKIDQDLTKWLTEERPMWGRVNNPQKGLDKKYVILNVYEKGEHVQNLLFDTSTQEPVMELGLGESCWCKIDILRTKNDFEQNGR